MSRGWLTLARAVTWPLVPLLVAATLAASAAGPGNDQLAASDVLVGAALLVVLLAPYAVGVLLTLRVPHHGAGWAFLGLATCLAWSAATDAYASAAFTRGVDLPAATLVATFSDSSFVGWFVFLALGLHYTVPAGATPRRSWLPPTILGTATVYLVCAMLRARTLDGPVPGLVSPWSVPVLAGPAAVIGAVSVVLLGVWLLVSVFELFSAFRRAEGESRQQLLWLVAGAIPLGPAVLASFAASYAGYDWLAGLILAVCVTTLALGAGLSVARYRLYDVERVVSDSSAYALSSSAVVAAFGVVIVVVTRAGPLAADSQLSTILATLAGVAVARPAYLWARHRVDRRFNRRRYDAVLLVRQGLADGTADVEELVGRALGPGARLLFPSAGGWVTAQGLAAEPSAYAVDVRHHDQVSARVQYDPGTVDVGTVAAVAATAASEIDNLGLRAELARQVEQVRESRTRLATAHLDERRRIERDLHDGVQQHLLAIALQLQSARLNGADGVLRAEVDRAVGDLAATVQDVRALAGGLQPAGLVGGGLRAAAEELAGRMPLRMDLAVCERRYPATLESAAWFVVAEGVANVVKHAQVDSVDIGVFQEADRLHVVVADHGVGGADAHGHGLQGLSDRVAALGGSLLVETAGGRGTRLEAVFPCA